MLIITHTVETSCPPAAVWHIWQDVRNWNTWDPGIEYSTLNGPFQTGTTGTLKPKGGPLVKTLLTRVEPMHMFVDEAKLPLTKIIVTHSMKQVEGKTHVTHHIEMKGALAFLFAYLIGRNMKKNLPQEMLEMVKKAEQL
jgi:carbon monoxide dehydrogenase subunit G